MRLGSALGSAVASLILTVTPLAAREQGHFDGSTSKIRCLNPGKVDQHATADTAQANLSVAVSRANLLLQTQLAGWDPALRSDASLIYAPRATANGWQTFVGLGAGGFSTPGRDIGAGYRLTPTDPIAYEATCVGYLACAGLSGNGMTGIENTGVGWHALGANAAGGYDTAIGVNSIGHCLLCQEDTAVGVDAMRNAAASNSASGASFSVAIGFHALAGDVKLDKSTGEGNVAIGVKSMDGFATGSHDVAVGLQTLEYPQGSSFDVAIGDNAMQGQASATASQNTAVGANAMRSRLLADAINNVALGYQAAQAMVSASSDVVIGANAGGHLATGNENTLIGYGSGRRLDGAAGNIFLGADAGATQVSGDSNILIGDQETADSLTSDHQLSIGGTIKGRLARQGKDAAITVAGSLSADRFREALTTPTSSSAECTAGQFTDDANYHYVCVASNLWKRVALTQF